MESRGQKRPEVGELPVDKRACSSLRRDVPDLENMSPSQTAVSSVSSVVPEPQNGDMETDATGTSYSEGEYSNNLTYGPSDSEGSDDEESEHERSYLAMYQQRHSSDRLAKLSKVILDLGKQDIDESKQEAALTNLCEQLSFLNGHSLTSGMVNTLSPILVKLAKHETNPNIMLFAIRAITYTCDVFPEAVGSFVRHEAVPALCGRLLAIEYLDVAEQCLQALDKVAHDQPLACLQSGVIMASLSYIDFFSTSTQRVALSIVVNICRKLPSQFPSSLMEALPILCGFLQYEDQQVVERAATCLIKITAQYSQSQELLDAICKLGVITQIIPIIDMGKRPTRAALSQTIYTGLIGLLSKLACGSVMACKVLFEHNISGILRDILSSSYLSTKLPYIIANGEHNNQMQEILKLLNELLPSLDEDLNAGIGSEKKTYLLGHPDILQKLGIDILPSLIQVVTMGADMHIAYGCVSFINKLIYFSEPEGLLESLKNLNISGFLAGLFSRKDHHLLILALKISSVILQRQSVNFLNSFVKDGVFFAIEALLKVELPSQFMFPVIDGNSLSKEQSQRASGREIGRCLCYALCPCLPSERSPCKLKQDSVISLAKQIKLDFFPEESSNYTELSEIHQELKALSGKLTQLLTGLRLIDDSQFELSGELEDVVSIILQKLNGSDPVSTFEFIESGVVKALLTFLSHGGRMWKDLNDDGTSIPLSNIDKRFQTFAKLSMRLIEHCSGDPPVLTLVRKLQNALSTVENFPVILGQPFKRRSSFALIPDPRPTRYPTFKVQFLKGEVDQNLCDFRANYVTVDPFASLKSIEEHLWSKVSNRKRMILESSRQTAVELKYIAEGEGVVEGNVKDPMETDISNNVHVPSVEDMDAQLEKEVSIESQSHLPMSSQEKCFGSSNNNENSPNLSLYFGDQHLDPGLTLYQAVLQQQMGYESVSSSKFWTQVYNITYRRALSCEGKSLNHCSQKEAPPNAQNLESTWLCPSIIFKMFDPNIVSGLDQTSPARDFLYLIKSVECMNRNIPSLLCKENIYAFADGKVEDLYNLAHGTRIPQAEFVNSRLTEKLEQQMQDPAAISVGGMPSWWNHLVISCPFLFAFDARCKYFHLSVIGQSKDESHVHSHTSSSNSTERRTGSNVPPRKKFLAIRDQILESASKMMKQQANHKAIVEVEYANEVGTGLGPTLEFYTLVSHEFRRRGMGMWREDSLMHNTEEVGGFLVSRGGLFPRPWNCLENGSDETLFSKVLEKFVLFGQFLAKALHDGRVLDLHLSKAFYKVILGKKLGVYDIQLFDPELSRALLKFRAISTKSLVQNKASGESSTSEIAASIHCTEIEELCLDFALPGYPNYVLHSEKYYEMVTTDNLGEYVSLVEDATINSGIRRQVDAFKAGFSQVFPIERTYIFNEEELERLLCGEQCFLAHPGELLDHIKFDHGYTASSPPIINLLELLQEFDHDQQRAFVQFVTGTPRLPPGGLASLSPRMTIVRKHSDNFVDAELPSAMTCANYLKLPPYSSKEIMKEKLLYAISEGQGSFHLS